MIPTLSSLVAPEFVVMTASGATNEEVFPAFRHHSVNV